MNIQIILFSYNSSLFLLHINYYKNKCVYVLAIHIVEPTVVRPCLDTANEEKEKDDASSKEIFKLKHSLSDDKFWFIHSKAL